MRDYLYNLATDKSKGFIAALARSLLWGLSLIYGLIIRILIFLEGISPLRLNCRVISVGNITLGGTGKTSLVEYIARYLKGQGHKVAVLSRGYKLRSSGMMGDEPYMLQKTLKDIPVIVDRDRVRAVKRAINDYSVDTVILDDGFQQWRIKKDLEIVTIDAGNPFGNRQMIPRGLLREPLTFLSRADIFILTKTNLNPDAGKIKETLSRYNPRALIWESNHEPAGFYNLNNPSESWQNDYLKGQSAALFCGIGDPNSFEKLISYLGINIGLSFRFADHYDYTRGDVDKIINSCREKNIDTIITTEKDAARFSGIQNAAFSMRILVLRIQLVIKNEEEFYHRLLKLYSL